MNIPDQQEILDVALALIHSRQHVSTKRLGDPGPTPEQVETILAAAGAAPDHGQITPWRLVIIPGERRHLLAEAFAEALLERDAGASETQKEEARQKAYRAPFLLLVIGRLDPALGKAHPQERLISAGCAVQNMLLAAHAMGYGAGLSSGRGLYAQAMRRLFSLAEHEQPLCFLAAGTVTRPKSPSERPGFRRYTSEL